MIELRPLQSEIDLLAIQVQIGQAQALLTVTQDEWAQVAKAGPAFVGLIDGHIIGAAGLAHKWSGSGVGWALMGCNVGQHWIAVHRHTLRFLDESGLERIECHVDEQFPQAHRWAQMLGFQSEGLMRKFRDGRDYRLYSRVR